MSDRTVEVTEQARELIEAEGKRLVISVDGNGLRFDLVDDLMGALKKSLAGRSTTERSSGNGRC
jgi:hypothetical protein